MELLLGPITELVVASCYIKSTCHGPLFSQWPLVEHLLAELGALTCYFPTGQGTGGGGRCLLLPKPREVPERPRSPADCSLTPSISEPIGSRNERMEGGMPRVPLPGAEVCWRKDRLPIPVFLSFPCGSAGKESACNAGDPGLTPGSGRTTGEGIGYPLQYSWASLVAQLVKNLPAMQETWVQSLLIPVILPPS